MEENLIPKTDVQFLEEAILEIGASMKTLANSRLRWDTIVTLVHADTKVTKRDIEKVLKHLWKFDSIHLQEKVLRTGGYGILEELMVDSNPASKPRLTATSKEPPNVNGDQSLPDTIKG